MRLSKPAPFSAEAAEQTAGDPSMDDILASIRRILSEEEAPSAAGPPPEEDDVLELDASMLLTETPVDAPAAASLAAAEPSPPSPVAAAPMEIDAPEPPMPADPLPPSAETLVAPQTASAAQGLMGNFMRSLEAERQSAVYRGGPTLEDIVRAEMRPLLKSWLDANLPGMVERVVRGEIERIAGRVS
jgi:uncharacterized protein